VLQIGIWWEVSLGVLAWLGSIPAKKSAKGFPNSFILNPIHAFLF
jgi:hypothetical protein